MEKYKRAKRQVNTRTHLIIHQATDKQINKTNKHKKTTLRNYVNIKFFSGLIFTTAQVVFITAKITFIFTSLSAVQIYNFHIFTVVYLETRGKEIKRDSEPTIQPSNQ